MNISGESQTQPKKKRRRLYIVLTAAILTLSLILSTIIFELHTANQTSYGPGPVEIEVTTDKPIYLQGEMVNFTIYVYNPFDWKVPHPHGVTFQIEENNTFVQSSSMAIDFPPDALPTFSPHSKVFYYNYSWNQKARTNDKLTLVQPGNYTFSVTFRGLVTYGEGNRCIFEIRENPKL